MSYTRHVFQAVERSQRTSMLVFARHAKPCTPSSAHLRIRYVGSRERTHKITVAAYQTTAWLLQKAVLQEDICGRSAYQNRFKQLCAACSMAYGSAAAAGLLSTNSQSRGPENPIRPRAHFWFWSYDFSPASWAIVAPVLFWAASAMVPDARCVLVGCCETHSSSATAHSWPTLPFGCRATPR